MNRQLYVILYSKYSQNSNNLIKFIQSCPIDLNRKIGLNAICIDNQKIRERITNCKEVQINSVPTLLIVYPTGGVEKYEGISAFNWIEETVTNLLPPPPPPPEPLPVNEKISEKLIEIEEEIEEKTPLLKENAIDTKPLVPPKPKPNRPKDPLTNENIIDLDALDNEEEIQEKSKSDGNSVKSGSSLMAQAMAMQKERESG
tara:strand:- start:14 stop:616 length:603 start_codon:yes stop_codon:yes gene_type:complete